MAPLGFLKEVHLRCLVVYVCVWGRPGVVDKGGGDEES